MNAAIEQTEAQATQLDRIVDVFQVDAQADAPLRAADPVAVADTPRVPTPSPRLKAASRTYLSQGNAAIDADWNEF